MEIEDAASLSPPKIAKENCTSRCGGVSIPYPFGIGPKSHCYFDEWYELECNLSDPVAKPFLKGLQLEVLTIFVENSTLQVTSPITYFSCKGKQSRPAANLTGSPFQYSVFNSFVAVSCGFLVSVLSGSNHTLGGCTSTCGSDRSRGLCFVGDNCCEIVISTDLIANFSAFRQEQDEVRTNATDCEDCAFLVYDKWFDNNVSDSDGLDLTAIKGMEVVPVELEWSLSLAKNNSLIKSFEALDRFPEVRRPNDPTPSCIVSFDDSSFRWYQCSCPAGFQGNPYLLRPCQDIDECKDTNPCVGSDLNTTNIWNISDAKCQNTIGGHACYSNRTGQTCELFGENTKARCFYTSRHHSQLKPILSGLGASIGLLVFLSAAWLVYKVAKKWKSTKRKEMFYKQNGGLLLEQQLSSSEINVERIKVFKSKELQSSTDNFNVDRIIGQGGQGTVYKGMLTDGRIVAVKKSKMIDNANLSEFINEVVILSQINHRNIVQLLGCCLETEVPLLVYEFIPNGNLFQYIHGQTKEFPLTWEIRLRIATEIAGALSYLHTSASFPIYHRDIKSTNILLDDKYRAKIADFGTSRLVAIDQTHLTTNVHGTFGYLDPEYYQSSQFTEKSDVYSFGVVLVELLTGKKPITRSAEDEMYKSLATYFIISLQEDSLFDILDARVVNEGSKDGIMVVATLAKRCLNLNGRKRPTMREITAELEAVQLSEKLANAHQQSCERFEFGQDYRIEQGDDVVSSSTMSTWEGAPPPSSVELPLL
ncbi:wall-associated receptor kinase-like 1 [Rosa chinensis]|uniref:wall-associated receptor kinase-like 1 n=1 Tax=Rosa chinensis TaxID=74649 RepID=UPI001AD90BC8|nr:wall-associated receptor kinase-like 1 [Rosa chinensis]